MTDLKIGDKAPDFTLPTDKGDEITLSSIKECKVVLYFYPKDNTPGCTKQACFFKNDLSNFQRSKSIRAESPIDLLHNKHPGAYDIHLP